jgi:hypothetical protein
MNMECTIEVNIQVWYLPIILLLLLSGLPFEAWSLLSLVIGENFGKLDWSGSLRPSLLMNSHCSNCGTKIVGDKLKQLSRELKEGKE